MTERNPGLAAIYARISDDRDGEARGNERQIEDCRAKAKTLGLTVIEPPFVDDAISASEKSDKKRPAYDEMLARARRGEFGTIIAYSNSRLTRRALEFEDLIKLHETHGTVIRTVVSGDDDLSTADGIFVARVKAAQDASEARRIAERVKRAVDQRKEKGEYHGSSAPFGYTAKTKKKHGRTSSDVALVKNDAEVAMIHEAVTRLLDANDSLYAIVRDWNAAGKVSRTGKPWRLGVLRNALTNPALIARTRPIVTKDRRAPRAVAGYPANWEPILDESTFDALTSRLVDPSRHVANPLGKKSSKYPLGGGLTVCGRCGKAMVAMSRKDQPTKYMCRATTNGEHENHPIDPSTGFSTGRVTVHAELLELYVFEQFVLHLRDDPYWQDHKDDPDPRAAEKIAEAQRLKNAEQAKIRRAEESAFDGLIDPVRLSEMIDRARARMRELDDEMAELRGKPSRRDLIIEKYGSPVEILSQWSRYAPDAKRTLLKLLIDKIVISDWPSDLPMTTVIRSGEPVEDFEARRLALQMDGMARRVVIEWRED